MIATVIMMTTKVTAQKILNTAIELAEKKSWAAVTLQNIAEKLEVQLSEIYKHYSQKHDIVIAWMKSADQAMLKSASNADVIKQKPNQKIKTLIMARLNHLDKHKKVSQEMVKSELCPGHIDRQIHALFRVKRTVECLYEATNPDKIAASQQLLDKAGLTTVYFTTVCYWLFDHSKHSLQTQHLLTSLMTQAELGREWLIKYICEPFQHFSIKL